MIRETFTRFDPADYLATEEDIAAYLDAAAAENDPALMALALGDVARARNMSALARETGLTREGLYKALSGQGNPTLATVMTVANALGLRLAFRPAGKIKSAAKIISPEAIKAIGTKKLAGGGVIHKTHGGIATRVRRASARKSAKRA